MVSKFRFLRLPHFLLLPAVFLVLSQSDLSAQIKAEMFSEPMSMDKLFSDYAATTVPELYSDSAVTYRFRMTGSGAEAVHIDLTGGETPQYSIGEKRYEMNSFQNERTSILITLPPIHEAGEIAILPILVDFKRLAIEEANRRRSEGDKIAVTGNESNRFSIPLPDQQGGDPQDSLTVQMNHP